MAKQTINSLPGADANFMSDLNDFLSDECVDRERLHYGPREFVVSGGIGTTDVSLTHTISACIGFPNSYYVFQVSSSHTYTATKDTYVYLRDDDSRTIAITGYTITYDSNLVFAEYNSGSTQPTTPTGCISLFKAVTDGTSITEIVDYRQIVSIINTSVSDHSVAATVGSLAYILNAMSGTSGTIEFPGNRIYNITANNIIIPIGITLSFQPGAVISIASGKELTINGNVSAVDRQIFSGNGSVLGLKLAHIEWWDNDAGDGATNCGNAFQSAIDAVELYNGNVDLISGKNYFLSQHVSYGNVLFSGNGATVTCDISDGFTRITDLDGVFISKTEDANYLSPSTISKFRVKDINFVGTKTSASTGTAVNYIFRLSELDGAFFNNCIFTTTCSGAYFVHAFIDGHHNLKNIHIDNGTFLQTATASTGGCIWIRGYNEGNGIIDGVWLTNCYFKNYSADEAIDISSQPSGTTKNIIISKCIIEHKRSSGTDVALAVRADDVGGTTSNVLISDSIIIIDVLNSRAVKNNPPVGTSESVQICNSEIIIKDMAGVSNDAIILEGFDIVSNVSISIEDFTSSLNNVYTLYGCGDVAGVQVKISSATEAAIVAGYKLYGAYNSTSIRNSLLYGIISTVDELNSCSIICRSSQAQLSGYLYNIRVLNGCKISVPNDSPGCVYLLNKLFDYPSVHIVDNMIIDSSTADSNVIMIFGNYDNKVYIRGNTYYGVKTSFGNSNDSFWGNIQEFDNNIICNAAGTLVAHSNRCPSLTNPWTLYGTGAELFPIGHMVIRSDPASASSLGWVKIGQPGTTSGQWSVLNNLP